ncbi:MAG TPA: ABC transporter substrate-binding protein [Clostridiaceae bacterium]
MLKKAIAALSIFVLLISLGACAPKGTKNTASSNNSNETTAVTKYPLTIKDSYGRDIVIEKEPKTIISVAPNVTETVFALSAQKELVGRTDYCNYPEVAKSIQSIGGLDNPNMEKIAELKPDLVIASVLLSKEADEKLASLNIKVVVLSDNTSLTGVYDNILNIGKILNANSKAASVVENMKKKVSEVTAKVKGKAKPSVYYVVSYGKAGNWTAGSGTFINDLILMAGGTNAASDVDSFKDYSMEKLIEKDPNIIICPVYYDTKKGILATDGYKDLTAIKKGKLYEIDNNMIDIMGPRVADGLEAMAKIIHPEAFK